MKKILIVLLPLLFFGCDKPEWEKTEVERKRKVQTLIQQYTDKSTSSQDRHGAYAKLREIYIRKRDIPELTEQIKRLSNSKNRQSLEDLISFISDIQRRRLPVKGWTTDFKEYYDSYTKAFDDLGYLSDLSGYDHDYKKLSTALQVIDLDGKTDSEDTEGAIELILTLEPESLLLWGSNWDSIRFLSILPNLGRLDLSFTSVTDIRPLKDLAALHQVDLIGTKVTDLTPLEGIPNIKLVAEEEFE